MDKFMLTVDEIITFVGKAAAWLVVLLMLMVFTDVVRRYVFNSPSAWIGELSVMAYGTLFMMCGAYTLAQNGHVRGDFLYGSMKPRTQATLDLILYITFFLPGIAALVYAGYTTLLRLRTAHHSILSRPLFRLQEHLYSCKVL